MKHETISITLYIIVVPDFNPRQLESLLFCCLFIIPLYNSNFRGIQFYPLNQILFWNIVNIAILLTWIGARPVEDKYVFLLYVHMFNTFPPFTVFSFLLQLPISSFASQINKDLHSRHPTLFNCPSVASWRNYFYFLPCVQYSWLLYSVYCLESFSSLLYVVEPSY